MDENSIKESQVEVPSAMVNVDWAALRKASHTELRRRLMARVKDRSTDLDAGPMPIDTAVYTDPERFEAENRELFRNRPILAAFTQDIPEPGDMFMFDEIGPAILLVRNKEGKVNAFLNMCMHRAARLVTECKRRNRVSCPFHAWTFDLDGKLVGIPGAEGFQGIDREARGLIRVPVAEWHGMIFVKGTPGDEQIDVEAHLGEFASELAHLELDKAQPMKTTRIDVACNWKYALDTYGEGYHFAALHPTTIGALALSNIVVYRNFGAHHRVGMPRAEFLEYMDKPESEWPEANYGGLYYLFPNTVINVNTTKGGQQFYGVSRLFPGKQVDSATTLFTTYKPGHMAPDADPTLWTEMHDFIVKVVSTEDYSVSPGGQRNMQYAPADFKPVLGANEIALQHIHRRIDEILKSAAQRGGPV